MTTRTLQLQYLSASLVLTAWLATLLARLFSNLFSCFYFEHAGTTSVTFQGSQQGTPEDLTGVVAASPSSCMFCFGRLSVFALSSGYDVDVAVTD